MEGNTILELCELESSVGLQGYSYQDDLESQVQRKLQQKILLKRSFNQINLLLYKMDEKV